MTGPREQAGRERLVVQPLDGYPAEIGAALWAMEEVRRMTLRRVRGLDQRALDWEGPDGREDSVGSLLYHIAMVEMDWLFLDIQEIPIPDDIAALFPLPMATAGRLARVTGESLDHHLGRLQRTRERFLHELSHMDLDDWRIERAPDGVDYSATPEWVVFHLVEHEAGHGAQIGSLIRRCRAQREDG